MFLVIAYSMLMLSFIAKAEVDLVIKNVTVISAISKHQVQTKPNSWVAISDNRIIALGDKAQAPKAKRVIDATGQFLMPGLMDSHTHLKTLPGFNFQAKSAKKMHQHYHQRQGGNYLYYGVTQLVDPSNTQRGIDKFRANGLAPDAFFCGAMPIFNGYNAIGIQFNQLHEKRPYYVAQETDPDTSNTIKALHQAKNAVQRLASEGANCAKVFIEDGFNFANHIPLISDASLKELTEHATSLNLPVMAHANATDMQKIAVDSGISIMAHGLWNWLEEQNLSHSNALPPKVVNVLDKIIERDIAYQPTLNVMRSLTDLVVENHLKRPEYLTILPQWQIDWYLSEPGQWFANEFVKDWGGASKKEIITKMTAKQINGQRVVKYLYDNGGTILLASDTPPSPTYASQPGLSTFWELQDMAKAGLDLEGILAAATLNNAKAYNLDNDYGTVDTGKIANLLLLNSNPLESIRAYNAIDKVILQGKVINRAKLHVRELNNF